MSLRERVYHWIQERLSPVFESRATYHLFQILPYAIIATAFILIVLKILGVNGRSVFYGSGSDRRSGLHADPVDVDAINFDYEIDQALLRGRYREAVRYTYLQLLKNLSDNDFISWKPDKTNGEYARELSGSALREPFEEVTRVFELVWYGEFPADESVFTAVRSTIADLTQNLVQEP